METQTLPLPDPINSTNNDYSSNVDTSRPFRSVKEAVAVFGERLLVGEIYSPKPFCYSPPRSNKQEIITSWKYYSPSPTPSPRNPGGHDVDKSEFSDTLKKLEAELEETKMELKLLKKRESETEIALANLNAELHMNMSKLAEAEATAAKNAASAMKMNGSTEREKPEEERTRELMIRMESSPSLAQILSIGEKAFGGKKEKKMMKKKPIVPLVTDLFFFKKKSSSTTLENPLYASPNMYFN